MLLKYLTCFFISMVPLVELRLAVPMAVSMGLDYWPSLVICVIGNLLPVPIIYFFARKVLEWGKDKKYIGGFFSWCLRKGESDVDFCLEMAEKVGVACVPGTSFFNENVNNIVRVHFAKKDETLYEALDRLSHLKEKMR